MAMTRKTPRTAKERVVIIRLNGGAAPREPAERGNLSRLSDGISYARNRREADGGCVPERTEFDYACALTLSREEGKKIFTGNSIRTNGVASSGTRGSVQATRLINLSD